MKFLLLSAQVASSYFRKDRPNWDPFTVWAPRRESLSATRSGSCWSRRASPSESSVRTPRCGLCTGLGSVDREQTGNVQGRFFCGPLSDVMPVFSPSPPFLWTVPAPGFGLYPSSPSVQGSLSETRFNIMTLKALSRIPNPTVARPSPALPLIG